MFMRYDCFQNSRQTDSCAEKKVAVKWDTKSTNVSHILVQFLWVESSTTFHLNTLHTVRNHNICKHPNQEPENIPVD